MSPQRESVSPESRPARRPDATKGVGDGLMEVSPESRPAQRPDAIVGAGLAVVTRSAEETEALALGLGPFIPRGAVLALYGDLASGKTCFVRGLAQYFAGGTPIHSPTFTLINEYGHDPKLYHLDLYRLSGPEQLADLGYEEVFDSEEICAVEWADRAAALLPAARVCVHFSHAGGDVRRIQIEDGAQVLRPGWQQCRATARDNL
ncbi:MAG: tRNA (adenosine(37)-N6)-threonylcarbamoyltransferase complex ATPase subunit type 1 TsaE [Candidatus Hydrogenedentes bacterium]|nr:tRNA (adenosine(37)-N6)-threonylcarbamoyltransferase complex ATPase subunit type 1 TsaE [Candidatus Hydrogenedentota bacterium]